MSRISEELAKRNALLAFIDFHRQSVDTTTRVVKLPLDLAASHIGLETDSFTDKDVECRQTRDGWVCVIRHLHLSKTQKGMPHVFEYEIEDDPTKARYDCRPGNP
jgi:hypothetical protein